MTLTFLALFLHGIVELQHDQIHTGVVSLLSQLAGDLGTSLDQDLAGQRSDHILSSHLKPVMRRARDSFLFIL